LNNNKDSNNVIGEVQWYLNGILRQGTKNIIKGNKVISQNNNNLEIHRKIMYIGNSRDYNEPFGIFCDLRIFRDYKYEDEIASLFEEKIDVEDDEDDIWKLFFRIIFNLLEIVEIIMNLLVCFVI
jgi:hypothetical protein